MPSFEILRSLDRGRYVATTQNFALGDIILQGTAYASAVSWDRRHELCTNCLQECSFDKYKCQKCQELGYCSSECQIIHQQVHNSDECEFIKTLEADLVSRKLTFRPHEITVLILASRILRKLASSESIEHQERINSFCNDGESGSDLGVELSHPNASSTKSNIDQDNNNIQFIETCCHLKDLKTYSIGNQLDFVYEKMLRTVSDSVRGQQITKQCMKKLLLRIQMNAFDIVDDLQRTVGAGFFNLGAMINHKCVPNAIMVYKRSSKTIEQVVKAVRPLTNGEEVCIGYVDLIRSTGERRQILYETYGFICNCSYCMNEGSIREIDLRSFQPLPLGLKHCLPNWSRLVSRLLQNTSSQSSVIDPDKLLDKDNVGKSVVGKDVFPILYKDQKGIENNYALHVLLEEKCRMIDHIKARGDSAQLFRCYKSTYEELQCRFSLLNRSIYSMLSELFSIALEFNLDDYALTLCELIVFIQTLIYHQFPNNPIRILQLQTYADLLLGQKRYHDAICIYNNIIQSLVLLLNEDHQFVTIAKDQLIKAKRLSKPK